MVRVRVTDGGVNGRIKMAVETTKQTKKTEPKTIDNREEKTRQAARPKPKDN